ncbi:MAG: Uma2 family endonuclease [Pirellula sp.]
MSTETPIHTAQQLNELGLLPAELRPNIDHIVTEDGAPVDNLFSEKQQRFLADSLYNSWKPTEPFVAMSNVGLFYAVKKPPFVPDLLVSLGVELPKDPFPKENRSYFIWEYGKAPDAVVEIVSNKEGGEDSIKLKGYAQIGIPHYVIYDPDRHLDSRVLRVYRLRGRVYELQADGAAFLESLGLGVMLWTGVYEGLEEIWLRWSNAHGEPLPSGAENTEIANQRAEQAEFHAETAQQRAETAQQRAETAEQRAETAEQRNERLVAQLHKLGVDPET